MKIKPFQRLTRAELTRLHLVKRLAKHGPKLPPAQTGRIRNAPCSLPEARMKSHQRHQSVTRCVTRLQAIENIGLSPLSPLKNNITV